MHNPAHSLGSAARATWRLFLQLDNIIIGLTICAFAAWDWITLYGGFDRAALYFSNNLYALPSLTMLSIFGSALYLTFAGIILLCLKPPRLRYQTFLPNLVALLAGFGVYIFSWYRVEISSV